MGLTELHRHLDASFRPSTLVELIRRYGIDNSLSSEEDIRRRFWITRPMDSLKEVLDCFVVFQKALRTTEVLERLGREAVEDAAAEGIEFLELRYSPSFTSEHSDLDWTEALAAFSRGVTAAARATGTKAGLICIVSRGFSDELALRTLEFAAANRAKFIGVDLAGLEEGYPCRLYTEAFKLAHRAGLPVTVHAGEASGPENIWEAIELLGARRIGHGIQAIRDRELLRRLGRDGILLETCPTSNVMTRSVESWKDHPLPRFLEAGVPASVSTDDPGIFGVPLPEEHERCRNFLGLSDNDLQQIDASARKHSFLK